jgi:hypothetical protein
MKLYTDEEFDKLEPILFVNSIEQKIHLVAPGLVNMTYYNKKGEEITEDTEDKTTPAYMFICDTEGIDERLITRVEFPTFSYDAPNKDVYVKIYHNSVHDAFEGHYDELD